MTQKAFLLKEARTPLVPADDHPIARPTFHQIKIKVTVAGLYGHDQNIRDLGIFLSKTGVPAVLANLSTGMPRYSSLEAAASQVNAQRRLPS